MYEQKNGGSTEKPANAADSDAGKARATAFPLHEMAQSPCIQGA